MATQFINGNELNHEIEQLFEYAKQELVLISPYIYLHDRYASVLRAKLKEDQLAIRLVFGKNEEDPSRSMRRADLEFFMQFPNIEIRYESSLHAKYYANEDVGIITSMNLYRYSQDHNIEAGIVMETSSFERGLANRLLGRNDMEAEAYQYFERVVEQSELIYKKVPNYDRVLLGLRKNFINAEVTVDRIAEFFGKQNTRTNDITATRPSASTVEVASVHLNSVPDPASIPDQGYCIITGSTIPFNLYRPLSFQAYTNWMSSNDESCVGKYCHFSGEETHGANSRKFPILQKNWELARQTFNF